MKRIALLLGLVAIMSGCDNGPRGGHREGEFDREHHRYFHENTWHDCVEHDEHCR